MYKRPFMDNKIKQERYIKLVKGCLKNNRTSEYKLYQLLSPKMFSICLRYAGAYHEAEDLLQDGFTKMFLNLKKYRGEGSFEGWVRRIFVNTAIEHYRKTVRMYPIVNIDYAEHNYVPNDIDVDLNVADLFGFVQKLSPGYRTVFNLYAVEGYTHKEVAKELGISEGTSKSQLARARGILQNMVLQAEKIEREAIAK